MNDAHAHAWQLRTRTGQPLPFEYSLALRCACRCAPDQAHTLYISVCKRTVAFRYRSQVVRVNLNAGAWHTVAKTLQNRIRGHDQQIAREKSLKQVFITSEYDVPLIMAVFCHGRRMYMWLG